MRILVLGAGGTGGYFGARLAQAGRDVTFLVRQKRAAALAKGLFVKSALGDIEIAAPKTVTAEQLTVPADLILLSCKAYDLDSAMDAIAPAVGPQTSILPILNGMAQLDALSTRFGAQRILGGVCFISATMDEAGRILHLNETHAITFGEQDGSRSPRAEAIFAALSNAGFDARLSEHVQQDMWEKWVFIAALAGITCLMRAAVGDIVAAGAGDMAGGLFDECTDIASRHGYVPRAAPQERNRQMLTTPGSPLTASMLRDVERNSRTEADHMIGDLLRRGEEKGADVSLLRIAYVHLKAYEARRVREAGAA